MAARTSSEELVGNEALKTKTGRTWSQWYAVLDKAGCKDMNHKEIVAVAGKKNPDMGGWWQQMVTVGYEQARGLRQKHEKPGGFEVSVSRVMPVGVSRLFQAWKDGRVRSRWLGEKKPLTIRKATANKSMRITWIDGKTSVSVNFYSKGTGKSQVAVQHQKLADGKAAERMKKYWGGKLDGLRSQLAG